MLKFVLADPKGAGCGAPAGDHGTDCACYKTRISFRKTVFGRNFKCGVEIASGIVVVNG